MKFDRQNQNAVSAWWWTVDRLALLAVFLIIAFGALLVTTASPAVAERIGLESFYFIKRQLVFLSISCFIIVGVSFFSATTIRRIAVIGFAVGVLLLIAVLFVGMETKGARRWISLFGFSLQPSEFMKPLFIVITAWMLSESKIKRNFPGVRIAIGLYVLLVSLLILQPDFGMVIVVSAVWAGQLFLAGLPIIWAAAISVMGIIAVIGAYIFLPHVARRIDLFLGVADSGGNYQVQKSLEAFSSGGIAGRGPGEGVVKQYLPDSHTDFIFAVAGEEFGIFVCLILVGLFAFVVFRGLKRMLGETNLFTVYAVSGLVMQFGIQAMVNMGVALNLLPTKGMTLPFISYGGSSMMAIALSMGMMLALTRKRYGNMLRRRQITFW
jgi:cell division protein FtsW